MQGIKFFVGATLALTLAGCELFSTNEPPTQFAVRADIVAFEHAESVDTPDAYAEFIYAFPDSSYVQQALARIPLVAEERTDDIKFVGGQPNIDWNTLGQHGHGRGEVEYFYRQYAEMTVDQAFDDAIHRQSLAALMMFERAHPDSMYHGYIHAEIERITHRSSNVAAATSSGGALESKVDVRDLPPEDQQSLFELGWVGPEIDRNTLAALRPMLAARRSDTGSTRGNSAESGDTTSDRSSTARRTTTSPTATNPASTIGDESQKFDEGRIIHHAPTSMVLGRPYFIEVAIQPVTFETTIAEIDTNISAVVGSGLAPGAVEPALETSITTVRAAELMTASLNGAGYEITATTEEIQPLFPGEPTKWQWEVIPRRSGNITLTFAISRRVAVGGSFVNQTVETIPLTISVESLDQLLAMKKQETPANAGRNERPALPSVNRSLAGSLIASGAQSDDEVCHTVEGGNPDRLALLITNRDYEGSISRLDETHLDGERMAQALRQVGFSVTHCRDVGRARTIRELSILGLDVRNRLDANGQPVSFFYYSGHGVNLDNTNYILPVDLPGATSIDVRDGAVPFADIYNRVGISPLSFVVFDACRTVMADGSKGFMRPYEPARWVSGLFQAFATEPGKTAADDGLYSAILSDKMVSLTAPANVLFKRVQDQVAATTRNEQNPNYIDRTRGGEFYFNVN